MDIKLVKKVRSLIENRKKELRNREKSEEAERILKMTRENMKMREVNLKGVSLI